MRTILILQMLDLYRELLGLLELYRDMHLQTPATVPSAFELYNSMPTYLDCTSTSSPLIENNYGLYVQLLNTCIICLNIQEFYRLAQAFVSVCYYLSILVPGIVFTENGDIIIPPHGLLS